MTDGLDPKDPLPTGSTGSALPSSSSSDTPLQELLRAVAHAPARRAPLEVPDGTRWGLAGRYLVKRRLGRGGMGIVYVALDTLLNREVALKVLDAAGLGEAGETRESRSGARLLREARIAAGFEHERIARVYDVGEHDGLPFVAMELVRGPTLRQWMAGREVSPKEAAWAAEQIAEGLSALHAHGVVHRDSKPENVMIAESGGVKLLDFGLARRALEPGDPLASLGGAPGESQSLAAMSGTPGYMAPEQCEGHALDARVDVFAFGVILYELVTGRRLFAGRTPAEIVAATVQAAPSLKGEKWEAAPPHLRSVAARALARKPEGRFVDGQELLQAIKAPPSKAIRAPRALLLAGATAALAAGAATGWVLLSRKFPPKLPPPQPLAGMKWIAGGRFKMGSTPEEIAASCKLVGNRCRSETTDREQPAHDVTVSPFFLDEREVTNGEFADWLMTSAPYPTVDEDPQMHLKVLVRDNAKTLLANLYTESNSAEFSGISFDGNRFSARPGFERRPAVQVTWDGARMYCESHGKRLPTEAEWELAARGVERRVFPWGSSAPACEGVIFARQEDGDCGAFGLGAVDVSEGAQDVTPEGTHGLGGNASEWVFDAFELAYYAPCGDCIDPRVEATRAGPEEQRVYRGGSWSASTLSRATARGHWTRIDTSSGIGFRCAANDPRVERSRR